MTATLTIWMSLALILAGVLMLIATGRLDLLAVLVPTAALFAYGVRALFARENHVTPSLK